MCHNPSTEKKNMPLTKPDTTPGLVVIDLQKGVIGLPTVRTGDSGEAERSFRREAERHSGMIPNTIGA
jgi:hypothetical protein